MFPMAQYSLHSLEKLNFSFNVSERKNEGGVGVLTINDSISIGEKIKQLRTKYGLTQEELAARTEAFQGVHLPA